MENFRMLISLSFRKIIRNKFNSLINIIGLTISITCFLIIVSWVRYERNFDTSFTGNDRIYRVALTKTMKGREAINSAKNYSGAVGVLKNELPEIENATGLLKDIVTVYTPENAFQDVKMFWVDSSVFKVFSRKLLTENSTNLFNDLHGAWISRSLATKLYGNNNPLKQKFKLNEGWEFYVSGIFEDFPENSHIKADLLIGLKSVYYYIRNFNNQTGVLVENNSVVSEIDPYNRSQWRNNSSYVYIKIKKGSSIRDIRNKTQSSIKTCINDITKEGGKVEFIYQPINDIHLKSDLEGELSQNGSEFKVKAITLIGILILIISWFNFVNISSLQFLKNAIDSGVKIAMGARKADVFIFYLTETFLFNAIAGLISTLTIIFYLPHGNDFLESLVPEINSSFIIIASLIVIFAGTFISSIYPYIVIKRFKTSSLLRRTNFNNQRDIFLKKAAVIFQFTASIILIIGTTVIFKQISFMQNQKLGINLEQTLVSYSPMTMIKKPKLEEKLQGFRNELSTISGVKGFTTAAKIPGKEFDRYSDNVHLLGNEKTGVLFSLTNIDQNFFRFFAVKFNAGNDFGIEVPYGSTNVIINNLACNKLGFLDSQSAIGQIININNQQSKIVGVVDDYHSQSLKKKIEPVIFFKNLQWINDVGYYCIKVSTDNLPSTIKSINAAWKKIYPEEPYIFSFLDDDFNSQYSSEIIFGKMYLTFSLLAIFIACMGLFALVKFSTGSRIKEIGLRKINGARVTEVIFMLNKDFLKWVIISYIMACPIAWYFMQKWLQNFAYRTTFSWWIFAFSGFIALIIVILTVSWQSWRAATRNPVEALRYE
jgi:putative ABC transport system permease protein